MYSFQRNECFESKLEIIVSVEEPRPLKTTTNKEMIRGASPRFI